MIAGETWQLAKTALQDAIFAVAATGLLFAVGDTFILTSLNLVSMISELRKEATLEVFLVDEVTASDIVQLMRMVSELDGVIGVAEKTPEQALEEMSSILGSDLAEILGQNPLPHCLVLRFDPESYDVDYLNHLSANLAMRDEVMEVHFASDWLQGLKRTKNIAVVAAALFSILVSAAALFVFVNLQRQVYYRRIPVVANLLLLGINPWSLRISSLIWSAVVGIGSGLLGLALSMILWQLFNSHIAAVPFFPLPILPLVLAGPALLALISSLISWISAPNAWRTHT